MTPLSLLRPFFFAFACLSLAGSALAATFGNFTYFSDGTSVAITSHTSIAISSLVIPAEIDGVPVRTISSLGSGLSTNPLRTNVTSVVIPEGVTTIGPSVFRDFVSLQSITVPHSVTSLGSGAFSDCVNLTSATFGNGLTALDTTFDNCIRLTTVDLPDQLVTLKNTFRDCTALKSIQIPASVTSIDGAFQNCSKLASVDLPASMTVVGPGSFMNCTALKDVTFPAGLLVIDSSAFLGCTGLTSLNLPPALATIGAHAFQGCAGLTSLTFPPALATVGSRAFDGCTGLTSVSFPASLKTIGDSAFNNCTGLTSLSLPAGLKVIEASAFQNCTALTSLVVPDSVTIIGDNAFWACPALTEVDLPDHFLASLANIGLDHEPELASSLLIDGVANRLANSPDFISDLADAIIAKTGHYGLSTQADIANVVSQTPQTVREVLAEVGGESPAVHGITSDLGVLTVKKGKPVAYTVTTTFGATAFAAIGLPTGLVINPATGAISGKPKKPGTYHIFLHAGVPGGGAVSAVKVLTVTP